MATLYDELWKGGRWYCCSFTDVDAKISLPARIMCVGRA